MELNKYNVTVIRYDPTKPFVPATAETFVLPVDSPDEEHAISSALNNCVAFTPKYEDGSIKSVAFACIAIAPR